MENTRFGNPDHVTRWGMRYTCNSCAATTMMWLEKGLCEGGTAHKPVPMFARCPSCGAVFHGMRHSGPDVKSYEYRPIASDESYFLNSPDHDCGIPIFQGFGKSEEVQLSSAEAAAAFKRARGE